MHLWCVYALLDESTRTNNNKPKVRKQQWQLPAASWLMVRGKFFFVMTSFSTKYYVSTPNRWFGSVISSQLSLLLEIQIQNRTIENWHFRLFDIILELNENYEIRCCCGHKLFVQNNDCIKNYLSIKTHKIISPNIPMANLLEKGHTRVSGLDAAFVGPTVLTENCLNNQ